jgi:hypothetical protein
MHLEVKQRRRKTVLDIKKHGKKITALFLLLVFVWPMIVNDGFLAYANNNSGGKTIMSPFCFSLLDLNQQLSSNRLQYHRQIHNQYYNLYLHPNLNQQYNHLHNLH